MKLNPKTSVFVFLLCLFSVSAVFARKQPKLRLDSLCYDLGKLVMDTVHHEVLVGFVNEGNAGLVFYKPRVSCECLKVEVPKDTVPAGASGVIRVLLDMGAFYMPNNQLRTMKIYTNDYHPQQVDFVFETIYKTSIYEKKD